MLLVQVLNSLSFAAILFMLATGIYLTFGLMSVVNLAHGSFFMLAGYVGYSVSQLTDNIILALLAGIGVGAFLSFGMERFFYRYLHKQGLEQMMLAFGFIYVFQDVARTFWGGFSRFVTVPNLLSGGIQIFGAHFPLYRLFIVVVGAALALGLWLFLDKTRIGALIRAGVDDKPMVELLGWNIKIISTLVFTLGGALAGMGGVLGSVMIGAYMGQDLDILLLAIIVMVIGGEGTLQGIVVGSLLLGFADTFGKVYVPTFSIFLVYTVLVLVLALKPSGLLGKAE